MARRIKTADLKGALKAVLGNALASPVTWSVVGAPIIGMAARSVENRLNAKRDSALKVQAYREMMDLHPHLARGNPEQTVRLYNSLYNASPGMARDPLAAGAYIDHIQSNTVHGQTSHQALLPIIERLSGVQKNISDVARNRQMTPRADKLETVVQGTGAALQAAYKENFNTIDAGRKKDMQDIEGRARAAVNKFNEQSLRERTQRVYDREQELGLPPYKHASKTPLSSMLRDLKV